jgi:RimJ/RimL family protein N-acetyltransferase
MTFFDLPRLSPPVEPLSARLRLRQWCAADAESFAALNADPQVMAFFPKTLSRVESDALMRRLQLSISERGWGLWAAELRATGEFAGFIGLNLPSAAFPFSPCVEVAWRLAIRYWGHGYATEGAAAAVRVGFSQLGLESIVSFTAVGNVRSRAVMSRLGMQESRETFEHPGVPEGNLLRTHCLYSLSRQADSQPS